MKFPQGFEVQLIRPNNGAAYADLTHGADRYVVGVADQPFEVRFTAPRSQFTTPYIRVTLKVDGTDVGIAKLVSANSPSSSFEGFVTVCKGETITRQFLFGKPETDTDGSSNTEAAGGTQAGSVDVSFTAVKQVAGCVSVPKSSAPTQSAAVLKPVDGNALP